MKVTFDEALRVAKRALNNAGYTGADAEFLADVFCRNTLEGVPSHGLNRLPRFIDNTATGIVQKDARPEAVSSFGGIEVWDGHMGPGPIIARDAMARAVELAKTHGIACVAVRNSNHWQRAGRYGWDAAREGMMAILWTNTSRNLPAWGATDAHLGNNPFVLAIPREKGPVVVDMSWSQYAYGRLEIARQKGERLPVPGGFDESGAMTDDPELLLRTRRVLPVGFWKGPAVSLALDMMAAGMSLGRTVEAVGLPKDGEGGLSQVFIAINYKAVVKDEEAQKRFDEAVDGLLSSAPAEEGKPVRYPSQNMRKTIERNLAEGMEVDDGVWGKILALAE